MDRSGEDQVEAKRPRRCVQSKLSFPVSPQATRTKGAAALAGAVGEDEGSNSEGKKYMGRRKRNTKLKPQCGDPVEYADIDKEARVLSAHREKSTRNLKTKHSAGGTPRKKTPKTPRKKTPKHSGGETPRKKTPIRIGCTESSLKGRMLSYKSDNVNYCSEETEPFSDLWSEAKKAAEENVLLSSGKQTHPFFSIRKATKRSSETKHAKKLDNPNCLSLDGDCCIFFPPVHVFDTVKDDIAVPNWKNWSFLDTRLQKIHGYCSMEISSVFDVSTKPLIFGAPNEKETKFDRLLPPSEKMDGTCMATTSTFSSEPLSKVQPSSQLEMVHAACNFSCSSTQDNCEDEDQYKMHKGRLASYYQRCICCLDCNLWTEKYRPEISLEVCGNAESVRFLSEWLRSWQERGIHNISNVNSRNHSAIICSEDNSYINDSDMDELDGEDSIRNVLLISGPTGSGKSAAIYACAREQGFKVIEVNASSLRNGAYMRQTFGEGVDSLGLTHWLAEDQTNQQIKEIKDMPVVAENGIEAHSIKLTSILNNTYNTTDKNAHFHIANRTLFLFEEVDVVFDEDRGFVSMILKLAETTRRPIILTSNTKRPDLPHLLDRLVLNFEAPSYNELVHYVSMVCAFEKVHISHSLLEHIVSSCVGDIRRILMLLQFWCQGLQDITEKSIQCSRDPVPFDITAVHLAIPKVIPWGFRCELSEKLEEEISNAVSAMEENTICNNFLHGNINSMETVDPLWKINTTSVGKTRMTKLRKLSIVAHTESSDHMNQLQDHLYDSDCPSTCSRKTSKRRRGVVLSSQSDDDYSSDELKSKHVSANEAVLSSDLLIPEDQLDTEAASAQSNGYNLGVRVTSPTSQSQEIYELYQVDQIDESRTSFAVQNIIDISEIASTSHACNTTRMQDVSCMSESSSTSGTEAKPKFSFISKDVSQNTSLFDPNISLHIQPGVDMTIADDNTELGKRLENHIRTADIHAEVFLQGNHGIGCFQNEKDHDFSQCEFVDNTARSQEVEPISKTWRRLRSCDENLKLILPNSKDVSLVASLASGLADLISESEIMFSSCNPIIYDYFEPNSTHLELDSSSWCDDQVEMGSTIAQHGLCLYAMKLASVGSCLDCNNTLDLAQEVLISSTSSTSLGKLIIQERIIGQNSSFKDSNVKETPSLMSIERESAADLYSAIQSTVPARLSMVLRGVAFHEYLSFVGQISRFECSRVSRSLIEKQKRRPRAGMHYLSSGAHQLSAPQAELLAQSCYFSGRSNTLPGHGAHTADP